jgi:hypothetical protein
VLPNQIEDAGLSRRNAVDSETEILMQSSPEFFTRELLAECAVSFVPDGGVGNLAKWMVHSLLNSFERCGKQALGQR